MRVPAPLDFIYVEHTRCVCMQHTRTLRTSKLFHVLHSQICRNDTKSCAIYNHDFYNIKAAIYRGYEVRTRERVLVRGSGSAILSRDSGRMCGRYIVQCPGCEIMPLVHSSGTGRCFASFMSVSETDTHCRLRYRAAHSHRTITSSGFSRKSITSPPYSPRTNTSHPRSTGKMSRHSITHYPCFVIWSCGSLPGKQCDAN